MTTTINAGAPLTVILRAVRRDGWGDLAGAHNRALRGALGALADLLPSVTAAGDVTVWEVAQASSYSTRWTARALGRLEELGLITWERGTIRDGRPTPSWLRVSKRALLELLRAARRLRLERDRDHNRARAARIALLRAPTIPPHKKTRRSDRVELTSTPRPYRGGAPAAQAPATGPETSEPSTPDTRRRMAAAARAAIAAARAAGTVTT